MPRATSVFGVPRRRETTAAALNPSHPYFNAVIKAATDRCTLYFPASTYNLKWVDEIKGIDRLSLQGDRPNKSIIKRMGPYWKTRQHKPGRTCERILQRSAVLDLKIHYPRPERKIRT